MHLFFLYCYSLREVSCLKIIKKESKDIGPIEKIIVVVIPSTLSKNATISMQNTCYLTIHLFSIRFYHNFIMVSKTSFCFCFLNRKSSKTKEEGSSNTKSNRKSRDINADYNRADGSSHGGATSNTGGNDAGAAAVAFVATSHLADMEGGADGSSHGGGGGGGGSGGDGGGGGGGGE